MTSITIYLNDQDCAVVVENLKRDCACFLEYKLISKEPRLEAKENTIIVSNILNKDVNFWRGFCAGTLYPQNRV